MEDDRRLSAKEALLILNISKDTLYTYVKAGKIKRYKVNQRKFFYDEADVYGLIGKRYKNDDKIVIYARVANGHNKEELDKQVQRVSEWCIKNGFQVRDTFTDICASMEFRRPKRQGFHKMLREVIDKRIDTIVMESSDRMARFGHEMFIEVCKYYKVKILYLNENPVNIKYKDEVKDEIKKTITIIKNMYMSQTKYDN